MPAPRKYPLELRERAARMYRTAEREELAALRKENAQLKRANEVLRTASAFFAAQLDPTRPR
jgi:transposase